MGHSTLRPLGRAPPLSDKRNRHFQVLFSTFFRAVCEYLSRTLDCAWRSWFAPIGTEARAHCPKRAKNETASGEFILRKPHYVDRSKSTESAFIVQKRQQLQELRSASKSAIRQPRAGGQSVDDHRPVGQRNEKVSTLFNRPVLTKNYFIKIEMRKF